MNSNRREEKKGMNGMTKNIKTAVVAAVFITVVGGVLWLFSAIRSTSVAVDVDDHINVTPEQISSIKAIGEWEFMAIANEELTDTIRKGLFSNDHLSRIYYGTVRLGINMHQVKPGWIVTEGDSITVTLPPITLLDHDFIDEARTKSFFESGSWSHQDREALYKRAYRKMLERSMTTENMQQARQNGEEQFRQMMRAMGFEHVSIRWQQ